MKGQILGYSPEKGEGAITSENSTRYVFKGTEFHGDVRTIRPGTSVDFALSADGSAIDVYSLAQAAPVYARSNIAAGVLGIILGGLGVHKFYLGYTGPGVIMLLCGTIGWLLILPGLAMWIIGFVEGIIYLTKPEGVFNAEYVEAQKHWF